MAEREEESELCVSGEMVEKKEDAKGGEKAPMAPWEQHASVINLPRYDYKAPSSFLLRSHSGFLITCPISYLFSILLQTKCPFSYFIHVYPANSIEIHVYPAICIEIDSLYFFIRA